MNVDHCSSVVESQPCSFSKLVVSGELTLFHSNVSKSLEIEKSSDVFVVRVVPVVVVVECCCYNSLIIVILLKITSSFIIRIHRRYRDLNTDLIPEDFTELDVQPKLKYKFLQQLPELKVSQ